MSEDNIAGNPFDHDDFAEEDVDEEILVTGSDIVLAEESAKEALKEKPSKKKKYYYKKPEFELAPGISSISAENILIASCPASSAYLFNTITAASVNNGSNSNLSLVARVTYTPRGLNKCSYDIYGLVEGGSGVIVNPGSEDYVTPFPSTTSSSPSLLVAITHIHVPTEYAGALAATVLDNLTVTGTIYHFASIAHTTHTHTHIACMSKPVDNPLNKKNPCLAINTSTNPYPPILYALTNNKDLLNSLPSLTMLPPPNMLFGFSAAIAAHATITNKNLVTLISLSHTHYPGETLVAYDQVLPYIQLQSISLQNIKNIPQNEAARCRLYCRWREGWLRHVINLSQRDVSQHKIAMLTDKPIPGTLFA